MHSRSETRLSLIAAAATTLILAACAHFGPVKEETLAVAPADQGWSPDDRDRWYRGSQGSRLIPERWLAALEDAGSSTLFMAPANFDRFNYLTVPGQFWPIGFARDVQSDDKLGVSKLRWYAGQKDREPWIGLNCAACHTAKLTYQGKDLWVDGGPTLADFQGFTDALLRALQTTAADPAKWDRFAARVLAPRPGDAMRMGGDTPANRALLKDALQRHIAYQAQVARTNETATVYGHGRLDAVGHILNKVALLTRAEGQLSGDPDAPVSYPFIWNVSQHDRLQWNGIVPNDKFLLGPRRSIDAGALVRNTSEVIGVFADVTLHEKPGLKGFVSSVDMDNLVAMEIQLARLYPPAWPLAAPDRDQVIHGDRLFRQHCAGCHADLPRADLTHRIKAEMTPIWSPAGVGTDPWMACNAYTYRAYAGVLGNMKDGVVFGNPLSDFGPTHDYLKTEAVGVLLGKKRSVISNAVRIAAGGEPRIKVEGPPPPPPPGARVTQQDSRDARLAQCISAAAAPGTPEEMRLLLAYKARPLNGIWATAPYLHNGSVKSLWELLLPPARRASRFWVGNREFDPVHVGFVDTPTRYGSWFQTTDSAGKPIHGNSNAGHDYGNDQFTDDQRMALIAYMKTL